MFLVSPVLWYFSWSIFSKLNKAKISLISRHSALSLRSLTNSLTNSHSNKLFYVKLILSEETNTFIHDYTLTYTYEGPDSSFDTLSRVDLQVKLVRRKRLKKLKPIKKITFIEETFLKCNFLDEKKKNERDRRRVQKAKSIYILSK